MTTPHEDIIIDLAPLYFAGEASAASRALVEDYFAAHPAFAAALRAAQNDSVQVPADAGANAGTVAVKRIQSQLRWRAALMALAILCTMLPFSFIFENDHVRYFMWRDAPATALLYTGVAVIALVAMHVLRRRTNTT